MYLKEIVWAWNKATECGGALLCQITRLQDQLESERDLRAALEIGLSMSAAQLSAAQTFDAKVCIAITLPGWMAKRIKFLT